MEVTSRVKLEPQESPGNATVEIMPELMIPPRDCAGSNEGRAIKVERPFVEPLQLPHQQKRECRCRIDISSSDTLERGFYAWLNGNELDSLGQVPCLFDSCSSAYTSPLVGQNLTSASALEQQHHPTLGFGCDSQLIVPFAPYAPECASSSLCSHSVSSSSSSASSSSSHSSISPGNNSYFSASTASSEPFASPPPHLVHNFHFHFPAIPVNRFSIQQPATHPTEKQSSGGTRVRRKRNVDKASGRGTNLYGRSYCPGRPLSMEERAQIIHLFHGGMKVNAISKQLCISHGCVSKIITRFRETGNLMPSSHSECRRKKRQQQQQMKMEAEQQQQHREG